MSQFSIFNFQFSNIRCKRLLRHSTSSWSPNDKGFIQHQFGDGFTLVELVVVFAILIVGSTAGIAQYRKFADTKVLDSSAAEVESALNNARISAVTQTISSVCTHVPPGLEKYSIKIITTPQNNVYEMRIYCDAESFTIKTKKLPAGIIFSVVPNEIYFFAGNGTSPGGSINLADGAGKTKQITIDTAGNITKQP